MRRVVGKATHDLDAGAFAQLQEQYRSTVLDVGTGDGKHVLRLARERTDALVVGLDASRDAMERSSRPKSAPANALFVWAAVEQFPPELTGLTEVHVLMPWGSLLRAVVTPDEETLTKIKNACAENAGFEIVLNLHAWRPSVPEVGDTSEPTPASIRAALDGVGWRVNDADYGAPETTSWARRLGREALWVRGQLGN